MRVSLITDITCSAPSEYFLPDVPGWVALELEENGPIECEGRGPFEGCQGCRFCEWFDTRIEET